MRNIFLLVLIVFAAFTLRAIGINYGLPFAYHDDEPILVNYALAYGAGDLNPHVFKMSPFLSYILFFFYGVFFLIGRLSGFFHNVKDFAYLYLTDPTVFYLIARVSFGLFCGTLSVLLIYLAGKKYFNRATGLLASFFLAFNYLHVRDSHYAYFDIPLTLCAIIFFIKLYDFFSKTKRHDYIQLGMVFGLAVSVKYPGFLLCIPLAAAMGYNLYISREKGLSVKLADLAAFSLSCLLVLFACNPFAFLSFHEFARDLASLPFIPVSPFFHLKISFFEGSGALLVILGIAGIFFSFFSGRKEQIILSLYAISYYWVIMKSSQPAERLVLSLVPVIILFASSVIMRIPGFIGSRKAVYPAMFILIAAAAWPSLLRIYYSDSLFLQKDTRTQAYEWVKQNIQDDSSIALDASASWFPRLERTKQQLKELIGTPANSIFGKPRQSEARKAELMISNPNYPSVAYRLFYLKDGPDAEFMSVRPALAVSFSSLRSKNVEYAVLSRMLLDNSREGFLKEVEKKGQLVKEFSPYREGRDPLVSKEAVLPPAAAFTLTELKDRTRYGPLIKIYRLSYGD